jgi:hypothetical protein
MTKPFLILSFILFISCSTSTKDISDEKVEPSLLDSSYDDGRLIGWHLMDSSSAISIDSMMTLALANGVFKGRIKGNIQESCAKAGCWISLDIKERDEDLFIHFQDYFTIPLEFITGDFAELTGYAILDTITIENQIADLDKMKENGQTISNHQYESITEDIIDISFKADAIFLKKI